MPAGRGVVQLVETARCSPVIVPIVGVEAPRSFQGECPLVEELCSKSVRLFLSSVLCSPVIVPLLVWGLLVRFQRVKARWVRSCVWTGSVGTLGQTGCRLQGAGLLAHSHACQYSWVQVAGCSCGLAVKHVVELGETRERKGHLASMWEKGLPDSCSCQAGSTLASSSGRHALSSASRARR